MYIRQTKITKQNQSTTYSLGIPPPQKKIENWNTALNFFFLASEFASETFERNGCLHMNSMLILKGFVVCNFYFKNRGMNSMLFLKDFLVSYLKKNVEYH